MPAEEQEGTKFTDLHAGIESTEESCLQLQKEHECLNVVLASFAGAFQRQEDACNVWAAFLPGNS